MAEFLTQTQFAGNELWRIVLFFLVLLVGLAAGRLARFFVGRAAERSATSGRSSVGTWLRALGRALVPVGFAIGLHLAVLCLSLGEGVAQLVQTVFAVVHAAVLGFAFYCLADVVDHYLLRLAERTESRVDDVLAPLVGKSVRITIAVIVLLNVVQAVSGKSITTILASLGLGGLAVALAGQDTLKNFFGSLVILGDRPFEIGDRIVVDGHDGPVVRVGFRSTKIRTLEGHLVTVPNAEMVNRSIQNIGKRPYIRRVMNITITYDTSPDKVQRALDIVKELLADHEGMSPDFPPRVFFSGFNDCSLNILAVYWYHPPEYWDYLAFSERLNLAVLRRFNDEGIEFAFPSQTIYWGGGGPAAPTSPREELRVG